VCYICEISYIDLEISLHDLSQLIKVEYYVSVKAITILRKIQIQTIAYDPFTNDLDSRVQDIDHLVQ